MRHASQLQTAEHLRLAEDRSRSANWRRWGTYLPERQWGTVREDYSASGEAWESFTHDDAMSRAYRWGEDGILGWCDRQCRLCFAFTFWNGRDPILKERLFGVSNREGNHGEDVKEIYHYLEATPTASYAKAIYRYPQAGFPYALLRGENARRGFGDPEFELLDTGIFDEGRYWDCTIEYAKGAPGDTVIRLTLRNAGPDPAELHLLPSLWFRNTWSWGRPDEFSKKRPCLEQGDARTIHAWHDTLGQHRFELVNAGGGTENRWLFTENETNAERLFQAPNASPYVKDAFHRRVIHGELDAVNPAAVGTKAAIWLRYHLAAGAETQVELRLTNVESQHGRRERLPFDVILSHRKREADEFHQALLSGHDAGTSAISRQATAGLLWTKQFYHYIVPDWLEGDPAQPKPPVGHRCRRNVEWPHLFARDILSMPDKWEYPWFAAWDLAFHMLPMARVDPDFAKNQLLLLLREWYLHPNGQMPAYEWEFGDVNPPVHAWAVWRVYKITAVRGERDLDFLERAFQKLLLNFTWWVNRKDPSGRNIFGGGFLGLDNIGVFDRSKPLPGGELEQADATAWMAFYCLTMLSMAIELAASHPPYEDIASKFFEHFVAISDATNAIGGDGLWDDEDGFYYDRWRSGDRSAPMRVRSMVGLLPLIAVEVLDPARVSQLPGFRNRLEWFLHNRPDLARHISWCCQRDQREQGGLMLLALPSEERLRRVLVRLFDEGEFLSPYGFRSLSKAHAAHPFVLQTGGEAHTVGYEPGESQSWMFGGNSNWRGPVWFPVNYLLLEALERYDHFYGGALTVEFPQGSGRQMRLRDAVMEVDKRLGNLFRIGPDGTRPFQGRDQARFSQLGWQETLWFHEYFHGETGAGLGASHQTGWTALISRLFDKEVRVREGRALSSAHPAGQANQGTLTSES